MELHPNPFLFWVFAKLSELYSPHGTTHHHMLLHSRAPATEGISDYQRR